LQEKNGNGMLFIFCVYFDSIFISGSFLFAVGGGGGGGLGHTLSPPM